MLGVRVLGDERIAANREDYLHELAVLQAEERLGGARDEIFERNGDVVQIVATPVAGIHSVQPRHHLPQLSRSIARESRRTRLNAIAGGKRRRNGICSHLRRDLIGVVRDVREQLKHLLEVVLRVLHAAVGARCSNDTIGQASGDERSGT